MTKLVNTPQYLCGKKEEIMFGVLVFIALVLNVLGSLTSKTERWRE